MRRVGLAAVAALLLPTAAFAQRQGAIEIGAFGRYSIFPDTLKTDNVLAGGGRIGYYIFRNLSVEGEASFGVSNSKIAGVADSLKDVSHTLWQARLLYNTPRGANGKVSLLVGAGYTYDGFGRLRRWPPRGQGASGLLGLRYYVTDRITARAEAVGTYIFEDKNQLPAPGRPQTFMPSVQLGISGFFRNSPPPPPVVRVDTVTRTVTQVDTVYRERMQQAVGGAGNAAGAPVPGAGATIVIGVVNFDFNKAELSSDARRILDDIATSLGRAEATRLKVILTGNTDNIGGESYNNRLSERRAEAVRDYLASKGIAADRLSTRAAGETNPVASNTNPEGRATNRRVLVELDNASR